jgi:hypothetical protein
VKEPKALLRKCFKDKEQFFFGDPILSYSFTDPVGQEAQDITEQRKRLRAVMRTYVSISDAGFFLNDSGKLCGWQILRIRQADEFVAGFNNSITEVVSECTKDLANPQSRLSALEAEWLRAAKKAIEGHHRWLTLEPGRISVTVPGRQALLAGLQRGTSADLKRESFSKEKIEFYCWAVKLITDSQLSIDQRKDCITFSLGFGDGEPIRANCDHGPQPEHPHDAKLLEYAKSLAGELKKDNGEKIISDFIKKHRDGMRD